MNKQTEALNKAMFMATDIRRGITPSIADAILLFQACKEALEQPAQEPILPFQRWSKESEIINQEGFDRLNKQPAQEPVVIKCADCGKVLEECEPCCCYEMVNKMADRFLYWDLPESVRSDDCVTQYGIKDRTGTMLLNVDEARLMVRHILGHKHDK